MLATCCNFLVLVLVAVLPYSEAIVGRDLVLTPQQALHLTGRRIYYEDQQFGKAATASPRSWERTLKHVTYVTLFANADANLSQLHDYHTFLQTPYVPLKLKARNPAAQFGDIVNLASGRLEHSVANDSYRFVEGDCSYGACDRASVWAVWQVQKIRHHDQGKYHYEMRFSITPLKQARLATPQKRRAVTWPQDTARAPQSYIQKQDDYPQSFSSKEFAERRLDRSFQPPVVTGAEQPQATFVHDIFQAAPPRHPLQTVLGPPKLNIGEYLKGNDDYSLLHAKGGHKLELFPQHILNLGYIKPTTFRPIYEHVKFDAQPELYRPQHELPVTVPLSPERYPLVNELDEQGGGGGGGGTAGLGVTHHYHHHFYMAPNVLDTPNVDPLTKYRATVPSSYQQTSTHDVSGVQFPSSSKESHESQEQQQEQNYFEPTTSVESFPDQTISAKPSRHQPSTVPLQLESNYGPQQQKPFVQSEPLEETIYRYSEPDPLYVQQNPTNSNPYHEHELQQQLLHIKVNEAQQSSVEAQNHTKLEQKLAGSEKQQTISSSPNLSTTTTTTTTTTPAPTTVTVTTAAPSNFVSTSTITTPLRALSRYRLTPAQKSHISTGKLSTTTSSTTEPPASKWKQRRKENNTSLDNKAKSSHRYESRIELKPKLPSINLLGTPNSSTTETPAPAPPAMEHEIFEVLTQKSVSKSVSIKVGKNGEEIPIIIDDEENKVKSS